MQCWSIAAEIPNAFSCKISMKWIMEELPALCSVLPCPCVFIHFLNHGIFSGIGGVLCPHQEGMRTRGGRVSNLKNVGSFARQH